MNSEKRPSNGPAHHRSSRNMDRLNALRALATFLPALDAQGFDPVRRAHPGDPSTGTPPWEEQREVVVSFVESACQHGWVLTDFDWGSWMGSSEAARLLRDPDAMVTAGVGQLARVLTALIRRDHFAEGALLDDFRTGLITRIVRRASVLAAEGPPEGRPHD